MITGQTIRIPDWVETSHELFMSVGMGEYWIVAPWGKRVLPTKSVYAPSVVTGKVWTNTEVLPTYGRYVMDNFGELQRSGPFATYAGWLDHQPGFPSDQLDVTYYFH